MKKAFTIILLVAAYSLCEALFLLFTIARIDLYPFTLPYQWIILGGQLLLIPGSAALFSRLLYGSFRFGSRALTILIVSIAIIVFLAAVSYAAYVVSTFTSPSLITLGLFLFFLLLVACGIGGGLFYFFRNMTRRTAHLEAEKRLAERRAGTDFRTIRWRNRGICWALGIPSALVLLVFLFLPEVWGIVSHLGHPRASRLGAYRVPIPITWIVLDRGDAGSQGDLSVRGLAGRGIAIDSAAYLKADLPLSTWTVRISTASPSAKSLHVPWTPKDCEIVGRKVFAIGREDLTCLEYWPSYLDRPAQIEASPRAFVQCAGPQRSSASLFGERAHLSVFYRMLEGIRVQ